MPNLPPHTIFPYPPLTAHRTPRLLVHLEPRSALPENDPFRLGPIELRQNLNLLATPSHRLYNYATTA